MTTIPIEELLQQIAYIGYKAGEAVGTPNADNLYEQTQIAVKRAADRITELSALEQKSEGK
jgi:hypothetical protein